MGQGKTLSMSVFATLIAKQSGAKLYARYKLENSEFVNDANQIWKMENSIFLWDEMWIDMDSREWKKNVDLTRFILQSRKKSVIIMYTAQHYSQVEKRVRKATDILCFCEKTKIIQEQRTEIKLTMVDGHTGTIYKIIKIKNIEPFFSLYNTYEVVKKLKSNY